MSQPSGYESALKALNDICSWVFVIEWLLKMIAFGPRQYFLVGWHRYEFINVLASIIDFFTLGYGNLFAVNVPFVNPKLFRAFRVFRMFKVMVKLRGLSDLLQTLRYAVLCLRVFDPRISIQILAAGAVERRVLAAGGVLRLRCGGHVAVRQGQDRRS